MESTRSHHGPHHPDTPSPDPRPGGPPDGDLAARYRAILAGDDPDWAAGCRDLRLVGRGGQGVVFFARREGADGFALPVALKVFSPEPYRTPAAYAEDMARVAAVAARVAAVQHENLVAVHDFTAHAGVRVMRMEWVDGLDLRQVLSPETLDRTRERLDPDHLRFVEDVILTAGPVQPRLKPGVAIHVLRDCLAALAALHRDGITHGDLKPSNVMLKRTGWRRWWTSGRRRTCGRPRGGGRGRRCTPPRRFSTAGAVTPQSDLASLGYVLVEMLAGRSPFDGAVGDRRAAGGEADARTPARGVAAGGGGGERAAGGPVPAAGGGRPGEAVPRRRGGRPGAQGRGRVPPPVGEGRLGERVRQRHPGVAGGAGPGDGVSIYGR